MKAVDHFDGAGPALDGPAYNCIPITPDTNTDLPFATRALYVGSAGDLVVDPLFGTNTAVTFVAVPAGSLLPIRVRRVRATSTAGDIVGLY